MLIYHFQLILWPLVSMLMWLTFIEKNTSQKIISDQSLTSNSSPNIGKGCSETAFSSRTVLNCSKLELFKYALISFSSTKTTYHLWLFTTKVVNDLLLNMDSKPTSLLHFPNLSAAFDTIHYTVYFGVFGFWIGSCMAKIPVCFLQWYNINICWC